MEGEPQRERPSLLIPIAVIIAGFLIAGAIVYTRQNPGAGAQRAATIVNQTRQSVGAATPTADDDPVLGNPNAPVTMIEFSDFECPFCGRFFRQTLPDIKETYIKTGKVKFVYRDFPISTVHANASQAAEAANCANEQGKFWEYHDKIFENQTRLSEGLYGELAQELGLNQMQFSSCLTSGKYAAEVQKDFADGQAAGVSGTPTIFVNNQVIVGAQPYSVFEQAIEKELAKAR